MRRLFRPENLDFGLALMSAFRLCLAKGGPLPPPPTIDHRLLCLCVEARLHKQIRWTHTHTQGVFFTLWPLCALDVAVVTLLVSDSRNSGGQTCRTAWTVDTTHTHAICGFCRCHFRERGDLFWVEFLSLPRSHRCWSLKPGEGI